MTAATSLSRLEPNIPRAYFDYALRSVIRTRDAIVDATAPFQTRTATLVEEAIAIGADVVVGFECCRVGRRVREVFILLSSPLWHQVCSDDNLVGLASESRQNAESFCRHAISLRFGFRIRSAAGQEEGYPAMKSCSAVDKTISGAEQLL